MKIPEYPQANRNSRPNASLSEQAEGHADGVISNVQSSIAYGSTYAATALELLLQSYISYTFGELSGEGEPPAENMDIFRPQQVEVDVRSSSLFEAPTAEHQNLAYIVLTDKESDIADRV